MSLPHSVPNCLAFVFVALFASASARAQIFYAPLQYQYGQQDKYYYGGNDPRVFSVADREFNADSVRVYSDAVPGQNASLFGYTVADAHNAAYASVARYFRKADVLAMKTPGVLIVPAQAASPLRTATAPIITPLNPPRPLMILPRPMPTTAPSDKLTDASH